MDIVVEPLSPNDFVLSLHTESVTLDVTSAQQAGPVKEACDQISEGGTADQESTFDGEEMLDNDNSDVKDTVFTPGELDSLGEVHGSQPDEAGSSDSHGTVDTPLDYRTMVALQEGQIHMLQNALREMIDQRQMLQDERVMLQGELNYSRSALEEMMQYFRSFKDQILHKQSILSGILGISLKQKAEKQEPTTWIGGTWLAGTSKDKTLQRAEAAFARGQAQEALKILEPAVRGERYVTEDLVNARLLEGVIVRSSGRIEESLSIFDEQVDLAKRCGFATLVGKARFQRGLALLYLDRYAESSWCLILATATEGHDAEVEANFQIAEGKRRELAYNDPGRYLPVGF